MRFWLLALTGLVLSVSPSLAEDTKAASTTPKQATATTVKDPEAGTPAPRPSTKAERDASLNAEDRLDRKTEDMMKGLDENQARQFAAIRTAHGTIRAVKDVQASLDRAVKSCNKANPDLAAGMTDRYQAWKNDVMPTIRKAENRLEKMILTQDFTRSSQVRGYLKLLDDVITHKNDLYTEVPVSSRDACEDLRKNMDKSQKVMSGLITETLGLDQDLKTKE